MRPVPVATVMPQRNALRPQRRNNTNGGNSASVGNVLAAAAGGVAGALASGLLYRAGLNPYLAGGAVTAGGVAVTKLSTGRPRWFGVGMAAAGAGQVFMTFWSRRTAQLPQQGGAADPRRPQAQGLSQSNVLEAFNQARQAALQTSDAEAAARAYAQHEADQQVAQMQAQMMRQAASFQAGPPPVAPTQVAAQP